MPSPERVRRCPPWGINNPTGGGARHHCQRQGRAPPRGHPAHRERLCLAPRTRGTGSPRLAPCQGDTEEANPCPVSQQSLPGRCAGVPGAWTPPARCAPTADGSRSRACVPREPGRSLLGRAAHGDTSPGRAATAGRQPPLLTPPAAGTHLPPRPPLLAPPAAGTHLPPRPPLLAPPAAGTHLPPPALPPAPFVRPHRTARPRPGTDLTRPAWQPPPRAAAATSQRGRSHLGSGHDAKGAPPSLCGARRAARQGSREGSSAILVQGNVSGRCSPPAPFAGPSPDRGQRWDMSRDSRAWQLRTRTPAAKGSLPPHPADAQRGPSPPVARYGSPRPCCRSAAAASPAPPRKLRPEPPGGGGGEHGRGHSPGGRASLSPRRGAWPSLM
ncbi:basic proline-rich protein-like [Pogoniulus pusillus]|uniref:basic proline-rich protein-like n=1 Tax=Pogoniulus pusillus TaxID=488313 RepID=UPI0030B950CE